MSRIEEKNLILPALYIIQNGVNVDMPTLISELINVFNPDGEDAKILDGRSDTKFSQKVRNLKSHRATNGMATYTNLSDTGIYTLTTDGKNYLKTHIHELNYLFSNIFSYNDVAIFTNAIVASPDVEIYDEQIIEGVSDTRTIKIKERSRKLRAAAVDYYKKEMGTLRCYVCGFSFEEKYGELGTDYIEIHHEKPICNYDDKGFQEFVNDAVKNLKPLCANCHRMIHRNTQKPLSVEKLKQIIKTTQED
ncbi:MAG: HNH endonuclease [Spirochaetia bacterium]|nr:HNH endonuclease [Spirochaetia bacterium]